MITTPRLRIAALAALLVSLAAPNARAQAVLGIGDDAVPVPRGHVRLAVGNTWTRFDSRFDEGGDREPLGAPFTRDTLGADALAPLRALEARLRSLSGTGDLRLSLGTVLASVDARVVRTPLAAELGVTRRLTIGAMVPIVHTRVVPQLSANPSAAGGNLGVNPALGGGPEQSENTVLFQQLSAAQTQLAALIAACQAGSSDPRCPNALAQGPALLAQAVPFATDLQTVFSGPFVPLVGTPADVALRQRLSGFASSYNALLGSPVITSPGPHGATQAFSTADLRALLVGPELGFEPLTIRSRRGVGDIELGARVLVLDTRSNTRRTAPITGFGVRLAVGGLVRLGTGAPDLPDNLFDIGTGDGQTDIEARAVSDLLFGPRFWLSIAGRYGVQLADERLLRISPWNEPFAPAYTRQLVSRDLGDYVEIEMSPRFVVSRYFAIGGQYLFRRKAEDRYEGTFVVQDLAGEDVTLDASVMNAGTLEREHRVGLGVVFSTVAPYEERASRLPIEISYRWARTIAGSGGRVPRIGEHAIQARWYVRLFGRDDRPPRADARR